MSQSVQYRVTGMDCASCAAKIEKAVRSAGVTSPKISTASQILTLDVLPSDERLAAVELAVSEAGYHLDRLLSESAVDSDEAKPHLTVGYRTALWIVIALNVGYGAIEMIGGFIAGSQALKADALDFLGDGLITLLGVLAIGWSLLWRARSALIQGLFLGALGFGVLANTVWRVFAQQPIEAELMGALALVALAVNVGAALVLVPHRAGDANVRAVWLFSRNDAIGNAAVVVAAVLVGWTGTSWPDLIVAFAIAGLFLQSSWVIVRDARRDISESRTKGA
ncbi:cation transporter [Ruegeria arenilitoris]|uniref:cation transporter n=1 Tax=Ruegeria arenilitoris TaxID=1173585 RepID=UPI00266F5513|nr:cation transporter [Ruegeria arenilitoris]